MSVCVCVPLYEDPFTLCAVQDRHVISGTFHGLTVSVSEMCMHTVFLHLATKHSWAFIVLLVNEVFPLLTMNCAVENI